jgi:Tfp pilus assembly protein PilE
MIVVLIIGILASLAVYTYQRMVNKARMTQAQTLLKHLHKGEVTYFSEAGQFTDSLALLDYDPAQYDYYEISVSVDNTGQDFLGVATGRGSMTGDLWTITKAGIPTQDNAAKLKF